MFSYAFVADILRNGFSFKQKYVSLCHNNAPKSCSAMLGIENRALTVASLFLIGNILVVVVLPGPPGRASLSCKPWPGRFAVLSPPLSRVWGPCDG